MKGRHTDDHVIFSCGVFTRLVLWPLYKGIMRRSSSESTLTALRTCSRMHPGCLSPPVHALTAELIHQQLAGGRKHCANQCNVTLARRLLKNWHPDSNTVPEFGEEKSGVKELNHKTVKKIIATNLPKLFLDILHTFGGQVLEITS